MKNNQLETMTLTINNVDDVIYDGRNNKYFFKDGDKKTALNPHHMIIRGSASAPNAPIVYIDSNDKKLREDFHFDGTHPTRQWYADTYKVNYMKSREITLGRWYNLSKKRKKCATI